MGKDVENLQISISLDTNDFNSQIKNINQGLRDLEKQFKTLSKGLEPESFQMYALEIDKSRKAIEMLEKQTEAYKKKQKALQDQIERDQKKQSTLDKDSKQYATLEKQISKNQKAYASLSNSISTNGAKIKNYANDILNANQAVQKLSNNAKTLEQNLASVTSKNTLNMSSLNKDLEQASGYFEKLNLKVKKLEMDKGFNTDKIKLYNQEIEKLQNSNKQLAQSKTNLVNKIKEEEKALEKARTTQKAYKKATEHADKVGNADAVKRNSKAYADASQDVSRLEMSLASLQDELRATENALESNIDSINDYTTQVNDLEAENTRLSRSLSNVRLDTIGKDLQQLGQKMKSIGTNLTTHVTAPIVGAGVAISKMTMEYQKSLNKVGTITGLTGKELQNYGETAIEISNKTGQAVTNVNEAIYQAVSGGVAVGEATKFVEDAMKLSVGGFADSAQTIDLLTTLYNVYGDTIGDVAKVSDKLIATQNLG